jgi:hypothetical protein
MAQRTNAKDLVLATGVLGRAAVDGCVRGEVSDALPGARSHSLSHSAEAVEAEAMAVKGQPGAKGLARRGISEGGPKRT